MFFNFFVLFFRRATLLFDQMDTDGIERNSVTWTVMMQGAFEMGRYAKALSLFQQMKHENVRDTISYHVVISQILKQQGDIELSLKFLNEMKYEIKTNPTTEVKLKVKIYNEILSGISNKIHSSTDITPYLIPMENV